MSESRSKITVILFDSLIADLDNLGVEIRLRHRRAIPRAEIISAIIEAAIRSAADLTAASSVEEITELAARAFARDASRPFPGRKKRLTLSRTARPKE